MVEIVPTNPKEYMRKYQRARRARIKEEKEKPLPPLQKDVKKNVKKVINSEKKEIGISRRSEPVSSPLGDDSKLFIDFNSMPNSYWKWCNSLDTKRCWELAILGKTHRGSTAQLKRDIKKKKKELDMVALMKKEKAPLYRNVMNEFKEKLEKLK